MKLNTQSLKQVEITQPVIQDGLYHVRLSCELKPNKGKTGSNLVITHEILDPCCRHDNGEPVARTIKLTRRVSMVKTDSYDPDQTLKRLGIALGLDVDGEHGEPEDIEEEDIQGAICQAQVVVRPPTINKDTGKEEYPEANDIKTWAAKADHFVAPPM